MHTKRGPSHTHGPLCPMSMHRRCVDLFNYETCSWFIRFGFGLCFCLWPHCGNEEKKIIEIFLKTKDEILFNGFQGRARGLLEWASEKIMKKKTLTHKRNKVTDRIGVWRNGKNKLWFFQQKVLFSGCCMRIWSAVVYAEAVLMRIWRIEDRFLLTF